MLGLPVAAALALALGVLGAPSSEYQPSLSARDLLAARDPELAAHIAGLPAHIKARRAAHEEQRRERLARAHASKTEKRASSCTFTSAASAMSSQASCSTLYLKNIEVPAGTTLDLSKLAEGTHVILQGTTTFGYKEWEGPLIQVKGTDITIDCDDCTIDAEGSRWWDGKGGSGGKTKPKFFALHSLTSSHVNDLNVKNTPVQAFSIDGAQTLKLVGVTLDNSAGDSEAKNTDAFDVGDSTSVTIQDATVYNQDDCVAINSVNGFTFTGGYCSGGHGLSIGSVGGRDDNTVESVTFESSSVVKSANGVRIKTTVDKTGTVQKITYKSIKLSSISKYGILIEQNYDGGDLKGSATNGIKIDQLTMDGVTGSVSSSGYDVVVTCGSGSCTNWTWSGVSVTGGKKYGSCSNVPSVTKCS